MGNETAVFLRGMLEWNRVCVAARVPVQVALADKIQRSVFLNKTSRREHEGLK